MSLLDRLRRLVGVKEREPEILDLLDPVPPHALAPQLTEVAPPTSETRISIGAARVGASFAEEGRAMKEAASNLDKNAERIDHIQQTIAKFERRKLPVPDDLKRELGWRRALAQTFGVK